MVFPVISTGRPQQLALHFAQAARQPQTLRQFQSQVIQHYRLGLVRAHHATQAYPPPVRGRRHHVGALDAAQLFQHRHRAVAQSGPCPPALQRLPQRRRQEVHQHVRLHPTGQLVPDRPDAQLGFLDADRGLRVGEMPVGTPQLVRIPIRHVAAPHVAAIARPCPGLGRAAPPPAAAAAAVRPRLDDHVEQPGRTRVLAQQPAHAPLDLAHGAAPPPAGRTDLAPPGDDAGHEPLTQRLFLAGAGGAAAQDEGLDAGVVRTALDLPSVPQCFPRAVPNGVSDLLETAAWRADDGPRAASLQPAQAGLADHAAVEDPAAPLAAVPVLHARDGLPQRRAVVAVAGENLVAQGVAVAADDQPDEHLLAVGAVVTRVAAPGLGVGDGLALEVGAGKVVEQPVVCQAEQPAPPLWQGDLQERLVGQQPIQGPREAIIVDLVVGNAQKVPAGGAAEPILGDVQLAGRLAEAGPDQHGRQLGPRPLCTSLRQPLFQKGIEVQRLPQAQPEPDVPEAAAALQVEAVQVDGDRLGWRGLIEEAGLPFDADDGLGQGAGRHPAGGGELAELSDRLVPDLATNADGADESPVGVGLAVPGDGGVAQVQGGPSWSAAWSDFKRVGWHYNAVWKATPDQERTYGPKRARNCRKMVRTAEVGLGRAPLAH